MRSRTPLADPSRLRDVIVLGGGNAALCAALSAREAGASVLLLECAPRPFRGGNSRHTRNLRVAHSRAEGFLAGSYPEEEFWDDLRRVTSGQTDEDLARLALRGSVDLPAWMLRHGVRFQPPLGGTLQLGRTNAFFLGGGKALVNAYYRAAETLGVEIVYDAQVHALEVAGGLFASALVLEGGEPRRVTARTVIAAAGGFEANFAWLREAWGEAADHFIVRGTPYNTGRVLRALLDCGAQPVGDARQCHAVAVDGRAPRFDGGIVTRVDCVPFGIVVNREGQRFHDEGEDFWPKRYASWGQLIAEQPGQVAHVLIDAKPIGQFIPPVFPPATGPSVRALARAMGLDPVALDATVARFNAAVR